jgi:predicted Zn-dependent peptidase
MPNFELVRLPNGLRVALDPMPGLGTAALGVWQRVGARWEAPDQNGIAHLFEHMAFKGAGSRDARQFAEAIENVGGHLNAATGYERTAYYARVVAEHAPFALDLIADILFAPHWNADDLEKEKGVVAQERGEAYDVPDDHVFELHQAALFAGQALGRPILGQAETLSNVSIDTLTRFRDAHLAPDRVVVSIAGAYDRAAFLDVVERRFGHIKPSVAPAYPRADAKPGGASEVRKLEQAHLVISWPGPPAGADALFAARLLVEIFGGGMSSRLFQEVRETRGLVYTIEAFLDTLEDCGRVMVYAGCDAKNARDVADLVQAELGRLAQNGPSASELNRAKAVARAGLLMGLEAPSARAEARASQIFLRDRLVGFEEIGAKTEAVTAEDVRALAQAALVGPRCAAVLGPKAGLGALAAFEAS